jgi:hypothetical protein
VFIVSFDDFMRVVEENISIEEDLAFNILTLDAPVKLDAGLSNFTIEWSLHGTVQYASFLPLR